MKKELQRVRSAQLKLRSQEDRIAELEVGFFGGGGAACVPDIELLLASICSMSGWQKRCGTEWEGWDEEGGSSRGGGGA